VTLVFGENISKINDNYIDFLPHEERLIYDMSSPRGIENRYKCDQRRNEKLYASMWHKRLPRRTE
jgi:hypothetical protein